MSCHRSPSLLQWAKGGGDLTYKLTLSTPTHSPGMNAMIKCSAAPHISHYYHSNPQPCTRGEVIGSLVVFINVVDTKIAKLMI